VKDKYGSDAELEGDGEESEDSEEAESEDEDGAELTPAVDAAILRTLARIKRRDPSIYDAEKGVFAGKPTPCHAPIITHVNVMQRSVRPLATPSPPPGARDGQKKCASLPALAPSTANHRTRALAGALNAPRTGAFVCAERQRLALAVACARAADARRGAARAALRGDLRVPRGCVGC
jgi:hypothetical protein